MKEQINNNSFLETENIESKLNWNISCLGLVSDLEKTLKSINIESVGDLCQKDLFDLLQVENLHLLNLAHINSALKKQGLTFQNGDLIDISDFYAGQEVHDLLVECDTLSNKRNQCFRIMNKFRQNSDMEPEKYNMYQAIKVQEMEYRCKLTEKLQENRQLREKRLELEAWRRGY